MASTTQTPYGTSRETLQDSDEHKEQQEEKTRETNPAPATSAAVPDVPQKIGDAEANEGAAGEPGGKNMSKLKVN